MPRTKQVKNVIHSDAKEQLLKCLRDRETSILQQLNDEDIILQNMELEHESIMMMMRNSFHQYLNVRLSDLNAADISTTLSAISMSQKRGRPKLKRSISDTAINNSNILLLSSIQSKASTISNGSDSGNSTTSNVSRSTSRSALRSGKSSQTTTARNRQSRSLSRNRKCDTPLYLGIGQSTVRKPLPGQRQPIITPITPKIRNCNVIPAIMRRPKQNEIAVSLHGSPLMVTTNTDGINANIPLPDGRVIAVQPKNMRFSEIADLSLEPESISDLQQLRDNLTRLCENVKYKYKK